jgi:transcriptional regulator with XRE-family HTH domain
MKQTPDVPFEVAQQLRELGERIRVARIRRRKGQLELATACGIGRTTLHRIESGSPSSAIGSVYAVLWALGLLPSTQGVADPDADAHGKTLEAAQRAKRVRAPSPGDDHDF